MHRRTCRQSVARPPAPTPRLPLHSPAPAQVYIELFSLLREEVAAAGPGAYLLLIGHNVRSEKSIKTKFVERRGGPCLPGGPTGPVPQLWQHLRGRQLAASFEVRPRLHHHTSRHPACPPRLAPPPPRPRGPQNSTCPPCCATPRAPSCPRCATPASSTPCCSPCTTCPLAAPASPKTAS